MITRLRVNADQWEMNRMKVGVLASFLRCVPAND